MINRIVRHYRDPWLRCYVRGKLRSDPIFPAAYDLLRASNLPVLDVGCGMGLLAFYLRERGHRTPHVGVDCDQRKIRRANVVAQRSYPDVSFTVDDVLETGTFQGHVMILDVLHYLAPDHQARLLERAASQVKPGGYCLIRDTLRDDTWRFRATQLEELLLKFTWLKAGILHYPNVDDVMAPFLARGFGCAVNPLWGKTPFNSYLFTFQAPIGVKGAAVS